MLEHEYLARKMYVAKISRNEKRWMWYDMGLVPKMSSWSTVQELGVYVTISQQQVTWTINNYSHIYWKRREMKWHHTYFGKILNVTVHNPYKTYNTQKQEVYYLRDWPPKFTIKSYTRKVTPPPGKPQINVRYCKM